MAVQARTENQPPPPPMVVSPVVFQELLAALGCEWRHVLRISYDRDHDLLTVDRLRMNGAGFPQEDRRGKYVVERYEIVVSN